MAPKDIKGFTLFEVMLVIMIMGLVFAIATPSITTGLENFRLKTSARNVKTAFNMARNSAVRERQDYVVAAFKDRVLIKTAKGKEVKKELVMPGSIAISPEGAQILFDPQGGSGGGVLEVSGKTGRYMVVAKRSGMIEIKND